MNLVDSSGWIEYFSGGPLADRYSTYLEKKSQLLVPTLVIYEVYRWIKRHEGEEEALKYTAQMSEGTVVPLDDSLALLAADLSLTHHLAMADSIVYGTAIVHQAKLITSDADFQDLPSVTFLAKK